MTNGKKLKVALLLGGTSPEREVSKSSAFSLYNALLKLNYEIILVDPAYGINQPASPEDFFSKTDYSVISNRNYVDAVNSVIFNDVDIALLALHGKWGEDGTIQSLLELRGIKYTGSNVLASAISMDKHITKIFFRHYGINTPEWFIADSGTGIVELDKKITESFGYPCIIKPNDQGSTVGLSICNSSAELEKDIRLSLQYSDKVMIEEYIRGRELTVAVLDKNPLPVLEIRPKHGIYDYECKYTSGMSEYEVPANIPVKVAQELQEQAVMAFNAVGCSVYGRVDFILDKDFKPYCLEINTLPGMTSTSLVPKMAKAAGIQFEELIDKIIKLSL